MEVTVGVLDGEIKFAPLIEKRLLTAEYRDEISIVERPGNYLTLHVDGRDQIFALSDLLADVLMEHLQIHFILQELRRNYFFMGQKEQYQVLMNTLGELWSRHDALERTRHDVSNRIAVCLFEGNEHLLSLDGVLRFRMKDRLEEWRGVLARQADRLLMEAEHREYVRMLRCFAAMRDPVVRHVSIEQKKGEYRLLDRLGGRVYVLVGKEVEQACFQDEEMLLSVLLQLSPAELELSQVQEGAFKELLRQVFIGRTREE